MQSVQFEHFFTSPEQSKWLLSQGFDMKPFFWWRKEDEHYKVKYEAEDEASTPAFMFEQIKALLPFFFTVVRGTFVQQGGPSHGQKVTMSICSPDIRFHPQVQHQEMTPDRELDAVFGMVRYLVENDFMEAHQPGYLKEKLVIPFHKPGFVITD